MTFGERIRQLRKEKTEAVADQAQKARVGQIADLSDATALVTDAELPPEGRELLGDRVGELILAGESDS